MWVDVKRKPEFILCKNQNQSVSQKYTYLWLNSFKYRNIHQCYLALKKKYNFLCGWLCFHSTIKMSSEWGCPFAALSSPYTNTEAATPGWGRNEDKPRMKLTPPVPMFAVIREDSKSTRQKVTQFRAQLKDIMFGNLNFIYKQYMKLQTGFDPQHRKETQPMPHIYPFQSTLPLYEQLLLA